MSKRGQNAAKPGREEDEPGPSTAGAWNPGIRERTKGDGSGLGALVGPGEQQREPEVLLGVEDVHPWGVE